jgi:hypothetical protein
MGREAVIARSRYSKQRKIDENAHKKLQADNLTLSRVLAQESADSSY